MATKQITVVLNMDTMGLTRSAAKAKAEMFALSSVANRTGKDFDVVSVSVDKINKKTHEAVVSLQSWRQAITTTRVIGLAFAGTLGAVAGKIVQVGAEAQKTKALLEGLSEAKTEAGRQLQAASEFRFLKEFSKTAPFSMEAITNAFVKLKTAGIDPTDGSLKAMVAGIAKVGGSDEQLKRATVAIQQMAGKGTISMEELRQQLGEAMPQAMRIMAEAAGMATSDFVDKVSKGQVRFTKQLRDKFFALVSADAGDAQKRMMETLQGQSNLVKSELTNIGQLIAGVKDGRVVAGGLIDELTKSAKEFVGFLQSPEGKEGALKLSQTLGAAVENARNLSKFLAENFYWIKYIGGAVIAAYSIQALKSFNDGVGSITQTVRQQIAAYDQMINRGQRQAEFEKRSIDQRVSRLAIVQAGRKAELSAIDRNIAALKDEQAVYQKNISLAQEQKRAAASQAYTGQANKNAGMSRLYVGAGDASGPISVANSSRDAVNANKARIASAAQLKRIEDELAAAEARRSVVVSRLAVNDEQSVTATERAAKAKENLARASNLVTKGMTTLRGVAGGLMAALGGPFGLAIIVAGAAFSFFAGKARDAENAAREAGKAFNDFAEQGKQNVLAQIELGKEVGAAARAASDATDKHDKLANSLDAVRQKAILAAEELKYLSQTERDKELVASAGRVGKLNDAINGVFGFGGKENELRASRARILSMTGGFSNNPKDKSTPEQRLDDAMRRYEAGEFNGNDKKSAKLRGEFEYYKTRKALLQEARDGIKSENALQAEIKKLNGKAAEARPEFKPTPTTEPPAKDKPDRKSIAANNRLDDDIGKLEATRRALVAVSQGAGASAEAIELVRAKIESMEDRGASLNDGKVAELYRLAKTQVEINRGLKAANDISQDYDASTSSLAVQIAELGLQTEGASRSTAALALEQTKAMDAVRLAKASTPDLNEQLLAQKSATIVANKALSDYVVAVLSLKQANKEAKSSLEDIGPDYWQRYQKAIRDTDAALAQAKLRVEELAKTGDTEGAKKAGEELATITRETTGAQADALAILRREAVRDFQERMDEINASNLSESELAQRRADRARKNLALMREQVAVLRATNPERAAALQEIADQQEQIVSAQLEIDLRTPGERMVKEWENVTDRMKQLQADWMSDFFQRLASGNNAWGSFIQKMLADWLQMKMQAQFGGAVNGAMESFASMIGGIFGGGGAAANSSFRASSAAHASAFAAMKSHTGRGPGESTGLYQMVNPDMFKRASYYHAGRWSPQGLKSWEEAAIIRKDESVLTPKQMEALGSASRQAPRVEINMINESGQPVQAETQGQRFEGDRFVVDTVITGMSRRGRLRDALSPSR